MLCGYKFNDMIYSQLYSVCHRSFRCSWQLLPILSECRDNDIVCLSLPLKVHDLINTLEMMAGSLMRRRRRQNAKPRARNGEEKRSLRRPRSC